MGEIPSDLIKRLTQLSDLNSFFKIIAFNIMRWMELSTFTMVSIGLVLAIIAFCIPKKYAQGKFGKYADYFMGFGFIFISMLGIMMFIVGYRLDNIPLNDEQVTLLNSIDNSEFQDFLRANTLDYGSNIKAVSKALKKFKNSSASE